MKLNSLIIPFGILLSLSSSLLASDNAQNLFDEKCSGCHVKVKPKDFSTLVAPPAMGVVKHVKMNYQDRDEAIKFITSYTLNPQKDKAVCTPNTVQKFGLMPSQKGNVTEEELQQIAAWMYDNIKVNNKSCNAKNSNCKNNCNSKKSKNNKRASKNKKASPFLITSGLPHFTKLVKQNWNNEELNLIGNQKKELLEIRKRTMTSIKDLSPRIKKLKEEIIMFTLKGESNNDIFQMVKELAKLKAEATRTHIMCIHDTKEILTKKQLDFLVK